MQTLTPMPGARPSRPTSPAAAPGARTTTQAQFHAATAHAIADGNTDQARGELTQHLDDPDLPAWAKVLIPTLQAILDDSRDAALADNPDLHYADAVEVRLLLEALAGGA